MFVVAFGLVAGIWEGYKAIGPERGGKILGWRLLPQTSDQAMPHIWEMFRRLARPEVRGNGTTIFHAVFLATWYSFRVALFALVLGVVVGLLLAGAVMMTASAPACRCGCERAAEASYRLLKSWRT